MQFLSRSLIVTSTVLGVLSTTNNVVNASNFFFDFEDGMLPEEALFLQQDSDDETISFEPTIETFNGNNVLRLSDDLPSSEGGASISSLVNPTVIIEDVTVSALLNPAEEDTNDRILLFARLNLETSDTYVFGIDYETDELFLSKVVAGVVPEISFIDIFNVSLDPNEAFFAEFTVIGNELTGRLFDETGTNELYELSFVDNGDVLPAGATGIAVDISDGFPAGDDVNNTTIDNFSATAVPEPSSVLSLLLLGALGTKISQGTKKVDRSQ